MSELPFDEAVANELLRYARMVVARGYIHNSLGNIAVRVPHPGFPHGVAYTKHAEVSLEEMTIDNVVITDIPTPTLLHGTVPTSVGHNLVAGRDPPAGRRRPPGLSTRRGTGE